MPPAAGNADMHCRHQRHQLNRWNPASGRIGRSAVTSVEDRGIASASTNRIRQWRRMQ